MILPNSSVKDIVFHIDQLLLLNLSDSEKKLINKFLSIESLLNPNEIKNLIAEDIVDSNWFNTTEEIIKSCKDKKLKSQALSKDISQFNSFLVYRILEDFLKKSSSILYIKEKSSFFSTIDNENVLWVSSKIKERGLTELMENIFRKINLSEISFDLKWLHQNKSLFYNNTIFK